MKHNQLIKQILFHIDLTEPEIELVISKFTSHRYLKGQYILQSGAICDRLNFVTKGSLKSIFLDSNGKEHIALLAVEEWWINDQGSFINNTPASLDIQCLENTSLLSISKENLEFLFAEIPKLERFFRIIILKHLVFTQKRLIDKLSLNAKDRYLNFLKIYGDFEQRFPQYLIASYLGISKEFLSKIRNEISNT